MLLVTCVGAACSLAGCLPVQGPPPKTPVPAPAATVQPAPRETLAKPTGSGEDHMRQARTYASQGMLDDAMAAANQAVTVEPDRVDAHLMIGDVHRWQNHYEQAEAAYGRATRIDPTNVDAHYRLGVARHLLGRFTEASKNYLFALTIDPDHFGANDNLAGVCLQLGRAHEAAPYARTATRLNPRSAGSWANLAMSYSLLQRYTEAVDAYRQAERLARLAKRDLLDMADILNKLGRHDEAVAILTPLVERSVSALACERLGYAQFKKKQHDKAIASFRMALLCEPNFPGALNGLGVCLMTQHVASTGGDPDARRQAMSLWRRSVQLAPAQPKIVRLIKRFEATQPDDS